MLLLASTIWFVGAAFGSLPGDEIPASAALGQVALYGVMMLSVGGVAFATAPWLGRTRAMAFGLIVLFASYLIYSYASLSPVIDSLKPLSFFRWTEGHRPIAGVSDWPSVAALAAVTIGLFAIGVVGFVRRDLGGVANVGWLRLPSLPAGIARTVHPTARRPDGRRHRLGSGHRTLRDPHRRIRRRIQRHDRQRCRRSPPSSRRSTRAST